MLHTSALIVVFLAIFSPGQCHVRLPAEGDSCTALVRSPERCAEPLAVTETVEPVDDIEGFGPNVCVTETVSTVSARDYVVERSCRRSRWYGFNFCRARCVSNATCSVRNITSRVYDCCPGYGARSGSSDHGFGYGRVNRHPGLRTLLRDGCTVELRESVAECLSELGLSDFVAAIEGSELSSRLADMDEQFTVFAPTNNAIGLFLSQRSLMTHVLDEVVRNSDLRSGVVLRPLYEDTLLHVTDVFEYRRNLEFTEDTFINGAQVNTSDACLAENGVVHTVLSLIPSSPDSIAELLAAEAQFTDFVHLLDAANITQFLQANRNTSRTVFAPTNAAFAKLPEGAVDCLLRPENKAYATKVVLTHITAPAEYTATLAQRSYIRSFYYYRLQVCFINGTIHLTRANVPLDETDITARNGVIHTLPSVLLADFIDYDKLCPPPATPTPPVAVDPSEPGEPIGSGTDPLLSPSPPELPEVAQ